MKKSWIAASIVLFCAICSFVVSFVMALSLNRLYDKSLYVNSYGSINGQRFVKNTLIRGYICDMLMVVSIALFIVAFIIIFTAWQKKSRNSNPK